MSDSTRNRYLTIIWKQKKSRPDQFVKSSYTEWNMVPDYFFRQTFNAINQFQYQYL